jgi:hypothetical protein
VADHLSQDQNVLIAYFDNLGKLASNAPVSYDKSIDTNVTTVGKLPNLSQGTIAAGSAAQKIAKVLADAATKAYREHEVNSIIKNTDDAVQELTMDLKKVVVVEYAGVLSNESEVLDTYYQGPMGRWEVREACANCCATSVRRRHCCAAIEKERCDWLWKGYGQSGFAACEIKGGGNKKGKVAGRCGADRTGYCQFERRDF